jgi:hypothetical protein
MTNASRFARYLGLVDPKNLIDKRNPEPHIHLQPWDLPEPAWEYTFEADELDRLYPSLSNDWKTLLDASAEAWGYSYHDSLQPYHVELWVEKETMNDILLPVCSRWGVNYVMGKGYLSITAVINLLERSARLEKPTRVLYVSDYDSAGENMPKQVSRQIEFWVEELGLDLDVRLEPVVLTAEQAAAYPPDPDKQRYSVELDAMEAIEPGKLRRIVDGHIAEFMDPGLRYEVGERGEEAQETVDAAVGEILDEARPEVDGIRAEAEEIYAVYRERLANIAEELNAELAPLDRRLETVQQAVREKLESLEPALPGLPEGEAYPDDDGWLFDTRRDYMEQLFRYKRE